MTDVSYIDPSEPVERQNERLLKITQSLIRRVERDTDETGNAYSLFRRAVALEGEIRARTLDLQNALDELHRVNEKLEAATAVADEANRAKTRFLAAASHDVLQPLNAAKLFIGSLQGTKLDTQQRRITERIRTAFDSVESLLGALLDISKLDTAGAAADITTMPVARILTPLATEFAPIARARGLVFSVVPSSACIESDPEHLRRIVQNLVSNAVRYCRTGKVLVGCRRRGGTLRIEVHDTGPGIAPDKVPEIFREFHRLESGRDGSDQGMGLGLTIVDRACRLLGHKIGIASEVGRGSLFSVTVPLANGIDDPAATDRGFTQSGPKSLNGMIVLALHSDAEALENIVRTLEAWGASVIVAQDQARAVQACEQLGIPPDVLLLGDFDETAEATADTVDMVRAIYDTTIPAIILENGTGDSAQSRLPGLPDVALASFEQPHRLRALLTWELGRAELRE